MAMIRLCCGVLLALMPAGCGAPRGAPASGRETAMTKTDALGEFTDHGLVAPPKAGSRGLVVTEDGEKRGVVLVWLSDYRGGYALLQIDAEDEFGPVSYTQGPRNLFAGPDGSIYVLFLKGIARFDPASSKLSLLARAPVPIEAGGEMLDGSIYFASGARLYSYGIPDRFMPGRRNLAREDNKGCRIQDAPL